MDIVHKNYKQENKFKRNEIYMFPVTLTAIDDCTDAEYQ